MCEATRRASPVLGPQTIAASHPVPVRAQHPTDLLAYPRIPPRWCSSSQASWLSAASLAPQLSQPGTSSAPRLPGPRACLWRCGYGASAVCAGSQRVPTRACQMPREAGTMCYPRSERKDTRCPLTSGRPATPSSFIGCTGGGRARGVCAPGRHGHTHRGLSRAVAAVFCRDHSPYGAAGAAAPPVGLDGLSL